MVEIIMPDPRGLVTLLEKKGEMIFTRGGFERFTYSLERLLDSVIDSEKIKEISYLDLRAEFYDGHENIGMMIWGGYIPTCSKDFNYSEELKRYYKSCLKSAREKFNKKERRKLRVDVNLVGGRECGEIQINNLP